ncbi:MAG: CAP domain-containing protein [Patescibacteria group bacterium]
MFSNNIKQQCKQIGGKLFCHIKDKFIPHSGNNHHPHALKHKVLVFYSVFLILVKVGALLLPLALPSSSLFSSAITPDNVLALTNQARKNLGLGELKMNSKLNVAAEAKANDMAKASYFAHTSPNGKTPWDFILNAQYFYEYAGENLAVHFTQSEGLQDAWMASPTHRANITMPEYSEIGVGVARGIFEGVETVFVAQYFGRPLSDPIGPVVEKKEIPARVKRAPSKPKPTEVAVTPAPSPVAEAVKGQAVEVLIPEPVIDIDSLKIAPISSDEFDVKIKVSEARNVTAQLSGVTTDLVKTEGDIWQGVIKVDKKLQNPSGEQFSIITAGVAGHLISKTMAWIAPDVSTQKFYIFNEPENKVTKLFGFVSVGNLDDNVRRFYMYFMIALGAALLLNIFIRIKVQHYSVIAHTIAVLGLSALLFFL